MLRVEFHCHTVYSKDSLTPPQELVEACRRKGIDRVFVTDHNSVEGARLAKSIDPERVIVGEEIMTTKGELLAGFVTLEIPAMLSPVETIKRLRGQGAFISVSHPFDRWRSGGWQERDLLDIVPLIDAIEVYNSRCMLPFFNQRAMDFALRYNIPGTVGSDAHASIEIGRSTQMLAPFENSDQLRKVIQTAILSTRWSPPWFHLISRFAIFRKKFNLGLDIPK
jgi:predicted metal-dependent phosphoesterase TrpH